jgi:hypothetical protein
MPRLVTNRGSSVHSHNIIPYHGFRKDQSYILEARINCRAEKPSRRAVAFRWEDGAHAGWVVEADAAPIRAQLALGRTCRLTVESMGEYYKKPLGEYGPGEGLWHCDGIARWKVFPPAVVIDLMNEEEGS